MCNECEKMPASLRDAWQEVEELRKSKAAWVEAYNKLSKDFESYKIRKDEEARELEAEIDKLNERIGNMT